jgi:hypothetical protein
VSGKKLALVCFFVGVFVLYAYQTVSSLLGLVSMPHSDYSLLALLTVFTNAYVAGFALGFCPPICICLMVKTGLIHEWEAGS